MNKISKLAKWKTVLLIIIGVIIALRIGYIAFRGEIDREYYTSGSYDITEANSIPCDNIEQLFTSSENRLLNLEFMFDGVADNNEGAVILIISSGDELIYQTNISLSGIVNNEWKTVFINAAITPGKEYKINLTANEECTQPPNILTVDEGYSPEIISSFSNGEQLDSNAVINYGYLKSPSIADKLVMILLWVLLFIAAYAFLHYFEAIKGVFTKTVNYFCRYVKPSVFITALELIGCAIIINSSGIEFQAPTKIILYIISLVAVVGYREKLVFIQTTFECTWKKVLLYFAYAYAAFALVGQRTLTYPFNSKLTIIGAFVYICTVFWCIPVIQSLLYYLDKLTSDGFTTQRKLKTWQFAGICTLILLIPAALFLYIYNPGISSIDTVNIMAVDAQNLHGISDWHPAFYTMVLHAILSIWNSTYSVLIVQYAFWAYVVVELLLFLRKKQVKDCILIFTAVFIGFNTANLIHITTIWKDIPYTISLLWAFVILSKLSIDYEEYKHKWYIYLELIVALLGVYFFRKNGFVPFILIAAALIIVLRKNIKVWCSLAACAVLIAVIAGPIYSYYDVRSTGKTGMYIGLSQDILGVYYHNGEVSEDTLKMINVMTYYNNAEYIYNATHSNQSYALDVDITDFIKSYIDTFIKNPVMMTRTLINREDLAWDIFQGAATLVRSVNYVGTLDSDPRWSALYAGRQYVSLRPLTDRFCTYTDSSQWINAIIWRAGLLTLLSIIAFLYALVKCGANKAFIILTPVLGHMLGLILSTGWTDFRYFWPLNLLNTALILIVAVICRQSPSQPEKPCGSES